MQHDFEKALEFIERRISANERDTSKKFKNTSFYKERMENYHAIKFALERAQETKQPIAMIRASTLDTVEGFDVKVFGDNLVVSALFTTILVFFLRERGDEGAAQMVENCFGQALNAIGRAEIIDHPEEPAIDGDTEAAGNA